MSLLEQELFTLPEHLSSPPVFNGVRVIRSSVLMCFCRCVVCSSILESNYTFDIFKLFLMRFCMQHVYFFKRRSSANEIITREQKVVDITRHAIIHCSALFACTFITEIAMLNDKIVL